MDFLKLSFIKRFPRKKIIFSIVLAAIVLGFVPAAKPAQANLITRNIARFVCYNPTNPIGLVAVAAQIAGWKCVPYVEEQITPAASDSIIAPMIKAVADLFIAIGQTFAQYSFAIFDFVVNILIKQDRAWTAKLAIGPLSITNNQGTNTGAQLATIFIQGWNIAKQWANVLIVIALIATALAFMLNFAVLENYKKLLLPILVTALFVNFSGVLVGFMIDVANVVMVTFFGPGTTGSLGNTSGFFTLLTLWSNVSNSLPNASSNIGDAITYATSAVVINMIFIITGITVLIMSILFIVRYVMLAILFMLSPLAFALKVIPQKMAQAGWTAWWEMLKRWVMAGVVAAFFANFGIQMAQKLITPASVNVSANGLSGVLVPLILKAAVIILFLNIGMFMAIKSSATVTTVFSAGAAALTGTLALTGKVGSGTFKSAFPETYGKLVDRSNKARDWFGSRYNRAAEVVSGEKGLAHERELQKNKERANKYDNRYKHQQDLAALLKDYNNGPEAQKASAANRLAEIGGLHILGDTNAQGKALGHMTSHGYDISKTIEKNPLLAAKDSKASEQERSGLKLKLLQSDEFKNLKLQNPGWSEKKILDTLITSNLPQFKEYNEIQHVNPTWDSSQVIEGLKDKNLVARAMKKADPAEVSRDTFRIANPQGGAPTWRHEFFDQHNDKKLRKSMERADAQRKQDFTEARDDAKVQANTAEQAYIAGANGPNTQQLFKEWEKWQKRWENLHFAVT